MKAFIVLNGQTDFDVKGCITGSNDPSLNDKGKNQSGEVAKELQSKGIDMIMASPQNRTMETAEIIAKTIGFEPSKITKGLKLVERNFGDFEGKPVDDVDMFALSSWFGKLSPPNGESIKDTVNRVIPYMNNMVKIFRNKTMLLVVPEHIYKILYWFFTGLPQSGKEHIIEVSNCALHEFETDDIPQEIKDYEPAAEVVVEVKSNDPGRLLSQTEIDAIIEELSGGTL